MLSCLHLLTHLILVEGLASLAWLAGLWNEGHKPPFDIYDDPFFCAIRQSVDYQLLLGEIRRVVMIPGGAGWHLNWGIWASFIWQKIITSFRSIFQEISPNYVLNHLIFTPPLFFLNINKGDKSSFHEEFFIHGSYLKYRSSLWFIICNHVVPCGCREGMGGGSQYSP